MDFKRKNKKIREKNESPNDDFFDRIFEWILRGFGEGFGKLLGEIWEALETLGSFFDVTPTQHGRLRLKASQMYSYLQHWREQQSGV